jgi:hypothetical protein
VPELGEPLHALLADMLVHITSLNRCTVLANPRDETWGIAPENAHEGMQS